MVGKNLEYFNKYFIIKNYKEKDASLDNTDI